MFMLKSRPILTILITRIPIFPNVIVHGVRNLNKLKREVLIIMFCRDKNYNIETGVVDDRISALGGWTKLIRPSA